MGLLKEYYKRENRKIEIDTKGGKFVFHIPTGGEAIEYQRMIDENGGRDITTIKLVGIVLKLFCDEPNFRDEPLDDIVKDVEEVMGIDDITAVVREFVKNVGVWDESFFQK